MLHLNDLQRDALSEVFNISVNQAAAALSEIVREDIHMSVPMVDVCDLPTAVDYLNQGHEVCAIAQKFAGGLKGQAMMVIPEMRSLELVRMMMGIDVPMGALTDIEQDALGEMGNIVLSACFASLADMFDEHFDYEPPQLFWGAIAKLLDKGQDDKMMLLIKIRFSFGNRELDGHIVLLVDGDSIHCLETALNKFLRLIMGDS
ncbi:hypothetical protein GCM10009092_29060 [Bowmanella denitrificans]|uniref:Chemotaxis protein CheC n=1 Tax=Bowmanella denitrificans TaxID=366582 RepID=A0ABN0XFQ0_9ALTE|nr:chemotaxis protein CheC [Bowmanella denitrificans]